MINNVRASVFPHLQQQKARAAFSSHIASSFSSQPKLALAFVRVPSAVQRLTPTALSCCCWLWAVRVRAWASTPVQSSIALSMSRQAWGDVEVLEQTHEWKCGDTKPTLRMVQPVAEEGQEAKTDRRSGAAGLCRR